VGALATAWQVRLPITVQVDLTNQGVEGATTVNTTVLGAAEADASSQFFHKTGLAFDSTNAEHIAVACFGVTYFLYVYRGQPKSNVVEAARDDWDKACAAFARTRGALTWNSPQTDSLLNPTRDDPGALPQFDRRVLGDLVPRAPLTGTTGDVDPLDFGRGAGA
jgi:hypothetical protein